MGGTARARTAQVVAIALVAVSGLAIAAPDASAAKNTKYCNAVKNLSAGDSNQSNSEEMKTLASSFRKASKTAPKSIKSAMGTIADYYDAIGDAGSNPAKVAAALQDIGNYTKAAGKWAKYTAKKCSAISG